MSSKSGAYRLVAGGVAVIVSSVPSYHGCAPVKWPWYTDLTWLSLADIKPSWIEYEFSLIPQRRTFWKNNVARTKKQSKVVPFEDPPDDDSLEGKEPLTQPQSGTSLAISSESTMQKQAKRQRKAPLLLTDEQEEDLTNWLETTCILLSLICYEKTILKSQSVICSRNLCSSWRVNLSVTITKLPVNVV